MRAFLDAAPDMCQSKQAEDYRGSDDIGFHGIAPTVSQCVAVWIVGHVVLLQVRRYSSHSESMRTDHVVLEGRCVRLEPLSYCHIDGLAAAAATDPSLYQWSPVPQGMVEATSYVDTALAWEEASTAVPFAIVRLDDDMVIGSTRFWNVERWAWPQGHSRHGRSFPDACEIGYTWLTRSAIRTAVNTEAKLLMLTHAFEIWQVLRVCFHTDVRNQRSRAALERIGGQYEGILRAHRIAADSTPRDSVRYSILASEWPAVKDRLQQRLQGERCFEGEAH
jgi:RimJ/RimL family protein N-acetyltransferase